MWNVGVGVATTAAVVGAAVLIANANKTNDQREVSQQYQDQERERERKKQQKQENERLQNEAIAGVMFNALTSDLINNTAAPKSHHKKGKYECTTDGTFHSSIEKLKTHIKNVGPDPSLRTPISSTPKTYF